LVLLGRLRAGDDRAFSLLIDRHHRTMLRFAQIYVSSLAVAEEVVQETWVAVLEGIAGFEGRSSLKTWIFGILINRAKTRGIREGRSVPATAENGTDVADSGRFRSNGEWAQPPRRWDEETPEKLMMRQEAVRLLEAALGELPPSQRAAVTLRDIEGLESAEVCNVLGISETNQRVLLHRARSKLRRALEGYLDRT
jgi:RNA polymerase sigma-70 factor (ECF subfamily)